MNTSRFWVPADETLQKLDLGFLIADLKKANVPAV